LCIKAIVVGNVLPILLFSSAFLPLINGQFGQPTILGFAAFVTGLTMAALGSAQTLPKPRAAGPPPKSAPRIRGRSAYAERLHGSPPVSGPVPSNGAVDR
jgi:hypothetical protein